MTKPTLDSILTAKQKLQDEIQALEAQEAQLRQEQTSDAHAEILNLIAQYAKNFNAKQRAEISSSLDASSGQPRKSAGPKKAVAAKYWLPRPYAEVICCMGRHGCIQGVEIQAP